VALPRLGAINNGVSLHAEFQSMMKIEEKIKILEL
jgi:hypothetical protein